MKLFFVLAALAFAHVAHAQPYVGVGGVLQRQEADGMIQTRNMLPVLAGYTWQHAGVEAFYAKGDYGAAALVRVPVGRAFALFARGAMHHLSGEITESTCVGVGGPPTPTTSPACPGNGSISDHSVAWSGWAPGLALGAQFTPGGDGLGIRVLVEKTRGTGVLESTRMFSMAVTYGF